MMKRLRSYGLAATLIAGSASISAIVLAQSPASANRAQQLHDEGRKLMDQGDAEGACNKFRSSLALRENMSTRFRFGQCSEKLGRLATAWKSYDAVAKLAREENKPKRAQFAQDAAGKVRSRVSELTIVVANQSATASLNISIDYANGSPKSLSKSDWGKAKLVDGGLYEVRATSPGYEPWSKTIRIRNENHEAQLKVPVLKKTPKQPTKALSPPPPSSPPSSPQATPASSANISPNSSVPSGTEATPTRADGLASSSVSTQEIAGYSMVALGVGVIGAGVALALIGEGHYANSNETGMCFQDICSQDGLDLRAKARREAIAGVVLWPAGIALAGAGLALWLTAEDENENPEESGSKIRVGITPSGISVAGTW